jgi:hypothetical protein
MMGFNTLKKDEESNIFSLRLGLYSATFQKMDSREVFPRKAYLLVSHFSFPKPVQATSRI